MCRILAFGIITVLTTSQVSGNSLNEFFQEQNQKLNAFFKDQLNLVEDAVNTSYAGAIHIQNKIGDYIEDQKKKISDDVNNYVERVQESGRNFVDTYSFMPTEDPLSLLVKPDVVLSVPSLIRRNGYDCETHTIFSDGFLLNVHRIPRPKSGGATSKNTVILQHGLFASSADWILNGPQKSLAYALADAGYDVWMTNIRGNRYSREHSRYKEKTKEYWNFSWHEVAVYDIPAVIDYIHRVKGNAKIAYIGHSMGTTILFTMLSVRPEYNNKLVGGIALAPEIFISNMESPIKSMASIASGVAHTQMVTGNYEFVPKDSFFGRLHKMCEAEHLSSQICNNVIFYVCGEDQKQLNETIQETFLANLGTGTSWKTAVHLAQMILSGKFQPFDYDYDERNQRMYGADTPPEYDLTKVTLNITLFWAQNDLLSNEMDVRKLHEMLPTTTQMYLVPFPKFNHMDYLMAKETPRLVNNKVLETLSETFQQSNDIPRNY
ncbi:unnamed protein product [Diatraea saccharalis]|uniref:AB hydrolase-1 domain-containing protein n=1 Tax=Diatraea saccharalis TaxID=40085 RepID=A0A9N9QZL4_9NEOP|nr:unnamed protein product [Diatraea saccharalis]